MRKASKPAVGGLFFISQQRYVACSCACYDQVNFVAKAATPELKAKAGYSAPASYG